MKQNRKNQKKNSLTKNNTQINNLEQITYQKISSITLTIHIQLYIQYAIKYQLLQSNVLLL